MPKYKNVHKYYLSVDGQIIDFKSLGGFKDMEDFLNISIFTGLFTSKRSLINALNSIGYIFENVFFQNEITIVKKVRTEDGFDYKYVTDQIVYKKTFDFLSKNNLSKFLYLNRSYFDAMEQLFEVYSSEAQKLILHFKLKIRILENSLGSDDDSEIMKELQSRNNSLNNFINYHENISRILYIIRLLRHQYDSKVDREYIELLLRFVDYECTYVRENKTTPNNRGFIKLAQNITTIIECYPELEIPNRSYIYNNKQREILKCIRDVTIRVEADRRRMEISSVGEPSEDPDNYMFLEESDYMNLLPEDASLGKLESVLCDIDSLNNKKGSL